MAEIVNEEQTLYPGVRKPASAFSRVLGLQAIAPAGVGGGDYSYSPAIGNSFRLRRVTFWWGGNAFGADCGGFIYIRTGTGVPDEPMIATQWEEVIPFWGRVGKPAILVMGPPGSIALPMNKPYTGEGRRFGLHASNGIAVSPFWVQVWFEIAEG